MAQQLLNLGAFPNDGTGDSLRAAAGKINDNFTELYTRTVLASDRTYYVATSGSDSNDGLTIGTPFLTIQKAIDTVADTLHVPASRTVTIQLADGTYTVTSSIVLRPVSGTGTYVVQGNTGNQASVIGTISVAGGVFLATDASTRWNVRYMTLQSTGGGSGLVAERGGVIQFQNLTFGTGMVSHIVAATNSAVRATGNYTISSGATQHINSVVGGTVDVTSRTVTLTGTPNFTNAYANVGYNATANFASDVFSGSATGSRYAVFANGVIITGGAATTFLPGNAAGTLLSGGLYT